MLSCRARAPCEQSRWITTVGRILAIHDWRWFTSARCAALRGKDPGAGKDARVYTRPSHASRCGEVAHAQIASQLLITLNLEHRWPTRSVPLPSPFRIGRLTREREYGTLVLSGSVVRLCIGGRLIDCLPAHLQRTIIIYRHSTLDCMSLHGWRYTGSNRSC